MDFFANNNSAASFSLGFFGIIVLLIIWSFVWKAIALWKSARNGAKGWYITLLLINTVGILEILYIFLFSQKPVVSNDSAVHTPMPPRA